MRREERATHQGNDQEDVRQRSTAAEPRERRIALLEAKVRHLDTELRVIREVNRLAASGQAPVELVTRACHEIASTDGMQKAWIYLNNSVPGGHAIVERGWGSSFEPLSDFLRRGHLAPCCRRALEIDQVIQIEDPLVACPECPLAQHYLTSEAGPSQALVTTVRAADRIHGFICVALTPDLVPLADWGALLMSVSNDIAGAIRKVEIEHERSRTEADLKNEAQRRQLLMNASRDGICILNQRHEVVEANRRFAQMLGYSPEEVLRLHTWDFEATMSEGEIRAAFADLTRTSATFESRHRRKNGSLYDVEVSASGTLVGEEPMVFTVSRDITEKKKMQANLAQADRLSSMGMLAAGVAHEINNPLSYVLYNLELLTVELPHQREQVTQCAESLAQQHGRDATRRLQAEFPDVFGPKRYEDISVRCKEALEGTRRIREITRTLSTFSRVEDSALVPVDIHYTIDCAVKMAYNELKYRAKVTKEYGAASLVLASEGALSQVFLNLLINASHAVDEGDVTRNEIGIRTWEEEGEVRVAVHDTGRGIPEDNLERIFEPFFTTKSAGVGSGLGLTISRNIIDGFGGRIEVESEPGRGTCFVVSLPRRQAQVHAMSVGERPASDAQGVKGRVLVIDDEPGVLNMLKSMLAEHEVVTASSGSEGREILEADQAFDVVLCDLMMPAITGMDLHAWLVDAYPELSKRVVFITGGVFTPNARDYLRKVSSCQVSKPFDAAHLVPLVESFVAGHRAGMRGEER